MTSGYWDKSDATTAAFTEDGWLRTGDLGAIDDDYIRLVGRTKDCYRCGSEQVVPKDAEDVLLTHPAVAQALVVPVPDPRMGETGAALTVLRKGATVDPNELRELVASRLARFKVPKHVLFISEEDIPLAPSGRPRRFLLSQRAVRELGLDHPGS